MDQAHVFTFTRSTDGYTTTMPDGAVVEIWRAWSRLGGEGWQTRHGGRTHPSRQAAARAEWRIRLAEARR